MRDGPRLDKREEDREGGRKTAYNLQIEEDRSKDCSAPLPTPPPSIHTRPSMLTLSVKKTLDGHIAWKCGLGEAEGVEFENLESDLKPGVEFENQVQDLEEEPPS